jgi:DNA repair protein SbcC/Rad50
MNIILTKLSLLNFKGIRKQTIAFSSVTDIFGDNGTGKTTIFDAFIWLLFGKDSSDRSDFNIKTLDENNQPFNRLDHEVSAVLLIDGIENSFKRVYREKWTKKQGSAEQVFTGHETVYYWNDVPMKKEDYQAKISELVSENIFKLITSTNYFASLKWQERRNVLIQMAGEINDDDVLEKITTKSNKANIALIAAALNQRKTIDQYKSELTSKKKKIKEDLDKIPARIDEANRSLPDEMDYEALELKLSGYQTEIETLDKMIADKNEAQRQKQDEITGHIKSKAEKERKLVEIENRVKLSVIEVAGMRKTALQSKKNVIAAKEKELADLRTNYSVATTTRNTVSEQINKARTDWEAKNSEQLVFNDGEFCCPTCKREFEADQVESKKSTLTANFNKAKSEALEAISKRAADLDVDVQIRNLTADGEKLKAEIAAEKSALEELLKEDIRLNGDEAKQVEDLLLMDNEYTALKVEIEELTQLINEPVTVESNSALVFRKGEAIKAADEIKKSLSSKDLREKGLARIEELEKQERDLNQELSSFEGIEFAIETFTKAKMDAVEESINGKFGFVKFKLFQTQINEGVKECCDILINGVPYSDANTASKIKAGLDIINALCNHYNVTAPVFIDNRESVVNIPEVKSQIINLTVSAKDKKLRVQSQKETLAA